MTAAAGNLGGGGGGGGGGGARWAPGAAAVEAGRREVVLTGVAVSVARGAETGMVGAGGGRGGMLGGERRNHCRRVVKRTRRARKRRWVTAVALPGK